MESIDILKGKKLFHVTEDLKRRVLETLRRRLRRERRILIAIVFGGFIDSSFTRDVDVAVYLRDPRDIIEDYGYVEDLGRRLSIEIGLPVDIVVLNHALDSILNRALVHGKPIVVKDWRLYYGLRMLAIEQKKLFHRLHFSKNK